MPVIEGTSAAETLTAPAGSAEDWSIKGLGGNDILHGANGDDWLNGGAGADRMRGYWGADTYYVDNIGDVIEDYDIREVLTTLASYALPEDAWKLTGLVATGQALTGN